jgi:hypothetical protein
MHILEFITFVMQNEGGSGRKCEAAALAC